MRNQDILAVILGGGSGTRLYPLTRDRTKPAVPLAGKYRLIDIPMSNCFTPALTRSPILTQFKSVSLHRHIHRTYVRGRFFLRLGANIGRRTNPSKRRMVPGNGRCHSQTDHRDRICRRRLHPGPGWRPFIPDGLPRFRQPPRPEESGRDHRRPAGRPRRSAGPGHPEAQ